MIESAVLYLLTSARPGGALGALIGLDLFPDELPQDPPYPSGTYTVVSAPRDYNLDGPSGCVPFRVQVDLYAATASGAQALRTAALADLSGFRGSVPVSPPVRVFGAFADNEGDSAVPELETAGPRVKRKRLDFIVWIKEG